MTSRKRFSVVITGADGFVGPHVARAARAANMTTHGIGLTQRADDGVFDTFTKADLSEGWPEVGDVDAVVHLAALAAVGPSFGQPQRYIETNSSMVTHMAEALLYQGFKGTLLAVSSGALYDSSTGVPLDESAPLKMSSPYAVSKVLVENQLDYYRDRGLRTVVARPFNHIGPGQRAGFLVPDLISKLSSHSRGASLPVGNLETRRDYLDVRDVAAAYIALVTAASHEHLVYNVCSGRSVSGREILEAVCAAMGIESPTTHTEPSFLRPLDPPMIVGNSERLRKEFGWEPLVSLDESVRDAVATFE